MVCSAREGGYPARVRRLRLRGGRDPHPRVRGYGRVRQIQQRTI